MKLFVEHLSGKKQAHTDKYMAVTVSHIFITLNIQSVQVYSRENKVSAFGYELKRQPFKICWKLFLCDVFTNAVYQRMILKCHNGSVQVKSSEHQALVHVVMFLRRALFLKA